MNDNTPLVSVIMPVYNGELYLPAAVNSILTQTYRNIELILIDDVSADSSRDIIKQTAGGDTRVTVYYNAQNLGLTNTLNNGIKTAKGQYILWIGQDDILAPQAIEKLLGYITDNPEYTIVYGNYCFISPERVVLVNCLEDGFLSHPYDILYENRAGGSGNALYRKVLFEQIGYYDIKSHPCEDYELLLRALRYSKIAMYPHGDVLLYKRRHNNCLTVTYGKLMVDKLIEIRNEYFLIFLFEWLCRINKPGVKRVILLTNKIAGEYIASFIKEFLKGYTLIVFDDPDDPKAKRRISALPDSVIAYTDNAWEGFINSLPENICVDKTYPLVNTKFNADKETARHIAFKINI